MICSVSCMWVWRSKERAASMQPSKQAKLNNALYHQQWNIRRDDHHNKKWSQEDKKVPTWLLRVSLFLGGEGSKLLLRVSLFLSFCCVSHSFKHCSCQRTRYWMIVDCVDREGSSPLPHPKSRGHVLSRTSKLQLHSTQCKCCLSTTHLLQTCSLEQMHYRCWPWPKLHLRHVPLDLGGWLLFHFIAFSSFQARAKFVHTFPYP